MELAIYLIVTIFGFGASYGGLRMELRQLRRRMAVFETVLIEMRDQMIKIADNCPVCKIKPPPPLVQGNGED